jgi:alkylation response protein AidB-like acyl-CoA dehydrogenase
MPVLSAAFDHIRDVGAREQDVEALGSVFANYLTLRNMSLSIARALDRGELPNVEAAVVKEIGTRFELDVIRVLRGMIAATPDPTKPGLIGVLADAIVTAPTFTLRGGTNEVLRGIIAKHLVREGGHAHD